MQSETDRLRARATYATSIMDQIREVLVGLFGDITRQYGKVAQLRADFSVSVQQVAVLPDTVADQSFRPPLNAKHSNISFQGALIQERKCVNGDSFKGSESEWLTELNIV